MKDIDTTVPVRIHLEDYEVHPYIIDRTDLSFDLDDHQTKVVAKHQFKRREGADEKAVMKLNGEKVKLVSLALDGKAVPKEQYEVDGEYLTVSQLPAQGCLEIETEINPADNKALEGLYKSDDIFCTQMEPEGFRHVIYHIDRPDNLSIYTTKITADKTKYPHILANGNLKESKDLEDGRHTALWEDPFPKPSYLFALVAGDFGVIEDTYKTVSGRTIELKVYVDHGNEGRAWHAMRSLQKAMKWDEDVYGLEYDLDLYMIVAVDAFNFGAMENKGLNIFNSTAVLADEATATDTDYYRIESIVAHEYFHNWTGNRVTCRDWFQLTLKEGLTVFRDQCFSADTHSAGVCRIMNVSSLRNRQFLEDSGPTSHPIRPASYIEINNFYTATVYEKGAEVIRMVYSMLGPVAYRKGIDLYFERHDGSAVTTEDFLSAMSDASGVDLKQFEKSWYNQKGTPVVEAKWNYDADAQVFHIDLAQASATPALDQEQERYHIPVKVGLLDEKGQDLATGYEEDILHLKEREQRFTFKNIPSAPVPSLLRGFSAPVKLVAPYRDEDLTKLFLHDSDSFCRFEAGQKLLLQEIIRLMPLVTTEKDVAPEETLLENLSQVMQDQKLEAAYRRELLSLPSLGYILENTEAFQPTRAYLAKECLEKAFAKQHRAALEKVLAETDVEAPQGFDTETMGRRSLKNRVLELLALSGEEEDLERLADLYRNANNMTDTFHALCVLNHYECKQRDEVTADFVEQWKGDAVVMNKWFVAQSSSSLTNTLEKVKSLLNHPCYDSKNPNKIRYLVGGFAGNLLHLHRKDGEGYAFIADQIIEIDNFNPSMASSLAGVFKKFARLDRVRQELMRKQLERILAKEDLSKDVYEIVSKTIESKP